MNFARLNTIYWTKTLYNSDSSKTIEADINDTFSSNLLASMNDWVCAVERMEISTNAIPYYDGAYEKENVVIKDTDEATTGTNYSLVSIVAYSLADTITQLNTLFAGILVFTLGSDGTVTITKAGVAIGKAVDFPVGINTILGISNSTIPVADAAGVSSGPRFGLGDQLQQLQIRSNLNLVSDTVGQTKTNIVTDVSVAGIYNLTTAAGGGIGYNGRDKLVYVPTQRRWLNFNSNAPLQVLRIFCEYVRPDGTSRMVNLPLGGVFNIKLGFYQRT